MNLRTYLNQSPILSQSNIADSFVSRWRGRRLDKGALLIQQDEKEPSEIILLDGCLASSIFDQEGNEVCVGLYVGPCVVTPNIARARNGVSRVAMVAVEDVSIAQIDRELLTDLMVADETIRTWANGILQEALSQIADREWCLAALKGAERLQWFRETFPGYESIFPHTLIASFLGITPVTLSRLRHATHQDHGQTSD